MSGGWQHAREELLRTYSIHDISEIIWRSQDGVKKRLRDMTDSHLTNAIRYVSRGNIIKNAVILAALQIEQERRANASPPPRLDGMIDYD